MCVCFLLSFFKLNYLPCNSAIDIVAGLWIFIEMKWLYYSWWTWTRTIEDICLPIYGYLHTFLWSPGVSKLAWPSSVPRGQWLGLKGRTESNDPIVSWVRFCSSLSPMPPPSLSTGSVTLFSYTVKVKKSLSHVRLFATPWTVARQPPLSMGFSRQEYWSGLLFPYPGDLPNPGVEPTSLMFPALAGGFFITCTTWEAWT